MAYSYSKLSKYQQCPARYKATYLDQRWRETSSPEAEWGTAVHEAIERRIKDPSVSMPKGMEKYTKTVDTIAADLPGFQTNTEHFIGVTDQLQPATKENYYLHGYIDFFAVNPPNALVVDFKTGKFREDDKQLRMYAAMVMLNHPRVNSVRFYYIWLKSKRVTAGWVDRTDIPDIIAEVFGVIQAAENDAEFPPKPSGLCKRHCPVLDCSYNGRRAPFDGDHT